ncbi:hypothetical protein JCM24511_03318 [Saitozyma sp. JCM 24511]|nr:hypothetical protein JCM24511_03318 [Saitozyma sp. JCM 24511]
MLLRPAIAVLAILGLLETHVSAATLPGTRTGIQKRVPSGTRRRRDMECYFQCPPTQSGLELAEVILPSAGSNGVVSCVYTDESHDETYQCLYRTENGDLHADPDGICDAQVADYVGCGLRYSNNPEYFNTAGRSLWRTCASTAPDRS